MSVRLILVRHGETDWNKEERLQGRRDIPLNKNGIRQLRKTAAELKKELGKSGEKPDIIISSYLARAWQSAAIIAYTFKVLMTINKNLAEKNVGSLEGKTLKEAKRAGLKKVGKEQQYNISDFGGETFEEVGRRIVDFLNYVIEEFEGKTVIVVTHAGILSPLSFILRDLGIDFSHGLQSGEYSIVEL